MCGRFNLRLTPAELQQFFDLLQVPDFAPRYNIAPTQQIVTISGTAAGRIGSWRRWGLVPVWSKEPGKGAPLINARSETIFKLSSFRSAIRKRRCLVPMSGFYEWTAGPGKIRQPWHIQAVTGEPLALGGIFEEWHQAGHDPIDSCSIVTTTANAEMAAPHQ
jgi:putative SOS response-associated peptidase YedK